MLQKLRNEFIECKRRQTIETSPLLDTSKITSKARVVHATLRVIQTKPVLKHNDALEQWDGLLTQINNACDTAKYAIETEAWDAIVGRLGHAELYAWLYAWHMQLVRHLMVLSKTSKFQAIYRRISCTLSDVHAHEYATNIEKAAAAFDQSCMTRGAAILAINCLLSQLQHWCPVYSCEI